MVAMYGLFACLRKLRGNLVAEIQERHLEVAPDYLVDDILARKILGAWASGDHSVDDLWRVIVQQFAEEVRPLLLVVSPDDLDDAIAMKTDGQVALSSLRRFAIDLTTGEKLAKT